MIAAASTLSSLVGRWEVTFPNGSKAMWAQRATGQIRPGGRFFGIRGERGELNGRRL